MSFLNKAGGVVTAVVKHVPMRGVLWAIIGFVVGVVCVIISFGLGLLVMERGAMILGYLLAIPFAIPVIGGALFGMHGLHRGAARAALEIEKQFGLVKYVTDRVMGTLISVLGGPVSNLPLQQLEEKLKAATNTVLKTDDEGKGLAAWVVKRAKKKITTKVETFLLAEYRAEQQKDGSGGGVSLEKVAERVNEKVSGNIAGFVMSPLNKQLAVFMTLYVLFAAGWWFWLFLLLSALGKVAGGGASQPV
ncbi:MAG: hypothetical protein IT381_15935 [Deltaproteobacteria bacterium]|nr:hypothetical protein [Deltaproteobacteria bacterium]